MGNRGLRSFGVVLAVVGALVGACVGDDPSVATQGTGPDAAPEAAPGGGDGGTTPDATDAADGAVPTTCGNKVKDGDETDVDCGGSCGLCATGKTCLATKDCASGLCAATVCAPWQRTLPGTAGDRGFSAAVDGQGNVYVTGDFFADLNLGSNSFTKLTSAGSCDAFVAKLDPSGTLIWSKRFGGTDCDQGLAITVDAQGDAFVLGAANSASINLGLATDSAHTSTTNYDLFVMRLSTTDGATKWAKVFGAGTLTQEFGIPRSYGIAVDSASNVWVAANATAATDYGGGTLTPAGADDALVLRLGAAAGAFVSARLYGGAASDAAQAVVADAQGVYVTGYFGPSIDFGPGVMNAIGGHDAFVVAFDVAGTVRWQRRLGGNNPARPFGSDRCHAIHTDPAGNVYVGGVHSGGPVDLGGGVTAADPAGGIVDALAASYKSDGTPRWALAFGGSGVDAIYGVRADGAGNVILAGYTESPTLDVGSGPVTHGLPRDAFLTVLSDANGLPKQGRFLGRAGSSEPGSLALRPKTSSLYLIGTFSGSLQSIGAFSANDAGAADLAASAGTDGWVSSLGNVP